MTVLFDRTVEFIAGVDGFGQARRFSQHRIDFQIDHQHGRHATAGEIVLWNLAPAQRAWLRETAEVGLLRAGHAGRLVDVFVGDVERIETDYRTPDIVTKVILGDGIKATTTERIAVSWPAGLSLRGAIERLARSLVLPIGYLEPVGALDSTFDRPRAFNGLAADALEELSQRAGLEWTVQDGQLYLVGPTSTRRDRVYVVSAATGLIGTPEIVTKTKKRREKVTGIRFQTLLLGELRPNHLVQLESREFRGAYKAERVMHQGGNGWESSFYTTVEAQEL